MDIMLDIIIFILSLAVVIKSADIVIDNSVLIAKHHGISDFMIGLTLVAVGTSLPEFATSAASLLNGMPQLAVSNIFGSNIANIGLGIGLTSILFYKSIHFKSKRRDMNLLIATAIATVIMFMDLRMTFLEGFALIATYIGYVVLSARDHTVKTDRNIPLDPRVYLYVIAGLIILPLGADTLIGTAESIMIQFGITQSIFGFIVIALGTSLPELTVCIMSVKKKRDGLAIGNIIGSNLFNLLLIFGTLSMIESLPILDSFFMPASLALISLTSLLYISVIRQKVTRLDGAIMLIIYIAASAILII